MASPALESFCCMFDNSGKGIFKPLTDSAVVWRAYNCLCLISAILSIVRGVWQLFPRTINNLTMARIDVQSFLRQNHIICCLAIADLGASLGIFVRSGLWLLGYLPSEQVQQTDTADFVHLFCAISSALVQYFYISTYFWTFCYALDVYRLVQDKSSFTLVYHVLGWLLPGLMCASGLVPLYTPSLLRCTRNLENTLPHYLSSYIPMLLVMIVNPLLYVQTSKHAWMRFGSTFLMDLGHINLIWIMLVKNELISRGRYTDQERNIVRGINENFFLVLVVFYVCWLPNILNGIFLLLRNYISRHIIIGLWQFMAVVNPLQAFLNSLVYGGLRGCYCLSANPTDDVTISNETASIGAASLSESSPLLAFNQ